MSTCWRISRHLARAASLVRSVATAAADFAAHANFRDKKLIIINQFGLNLKFRHRATVDNVVVTCMRSLK